MGCNKSSNNKSGQTPRALIDGAEIGGQAQGLVGAERDGRSRLRVPLLLFGRLQKTSLRRFVYNVQFEQRDEHNSNVLMVRWSPKSAQKVSTLLFVCQNIIVGQVRRNAGVQYKIHVENTKPHKKIG